MDAKTLDAIVKNHLHCGTFHGAGPYSASQFSRTSPEDTGSWNTYLGVLPIEISYTKGGARSLNPSNSNNDSLTGSLIDDSSKAVVLLSTVVQKQKKKIGEKKECTSPGFSLFGFQLVAPSYVVSDVYETRISPLYFPRDGYRFCSEGKEKDLAYACTLVARDDRWDKRSGVFTSYTCVVPENILREIEQDPSVMLKLFELASPQYFEKQGRNNAVRPFEKVKEYVVEDHRLTKPLVLI